MEIVSLPLITIFDVTIPCTFYPINILKLNKLAISLKDLESINNATYDIPFDEPAETRMHPGFMLLLIVGYGIVVLTGVIGNASLALTLCFASSSRIRNPLLMALCLADLLVSMVSAPSTVVNMLMNEVPTLICRFIHYVEAMPVAASTISFLMLSMDRYATVKHPRLAQLRQRRHLHTTLAIFSWALAISICIPFWFANKTPKSTSIPTNQKNNQNSSLTNIITIKSCEANFKSSGGFISYILLHTLIVFIVPSIGIFFNHCGVRQKLCALSLTARAAHGELPLPMPILRRPTHVIIVTGITNAHQGLKSDDSSKEDIQLKTMRRPGCSRHHGIKSANPISPRAMREIRTQQQRQKINSGPSVQYPATPGIPLPQTSTLRSRKRLGNMLIASSLIFIGCWAPHVFCVIYTNFGNERYFSEPLRYFNLLLGYFHSAISPIVYWALNHNTLKQSSCAPGMPFVSMQKFLRSRLRPTTVPPSASSTNEAALGPFNPNLIKTTPKHYRAQASSHYLY